MRHLEWSNSQRWNRQWWFPGVECRGEWGVNTQQYCDSVGEDKNFLEMDGGDGCTAM